MNYILPCLNTALKNSHTINRTTRQKINNTNKQKEKQTFLTAKIHHLNLKSPSNNVKIQSEETLTTQVYFSVTTKQM